MRILLTGKNSKDIKGFVKDFGFEVVTANPDVIISYGGDGTLLYSERVYPGVPKLAIRDNLICKKCPEHKEEVLLEGLLEHKLQLKEYSKLETKLGDKTFYALNDFVIRNALPIHTIRFLTSATGEKLLIGDGIVIAAPFGSTGYFQSITGGSFERGLPRLGGGFGVAFNNITEHTPPVFLQEKDELTFKLVRGNATFSFDNNPEILSLEENAALTFKLSSEKAQIYELESLRCPNCIITRG